MKLVIDEKILKEHNLNLNEYLFLMFNARGGDAEECISSLVKKGWVHRDLFSIGKVVLSDNHKEELLSISIESETTESKVEFEDLAVKLRELYPKGKKAGTSYMWRDTTATIVRKLKTLVAKYNFHFTEEQAIQATKAYVSSFNGDYRYMQLLKYFLLKTTTNASGDVEIRSEFMSYIDNEGQEDTPQDWTSTII